jgi:hypothetical protein
VVEQLRPDIESAKQRMNVSIGGKRELRKLPEHLWPEEKVEEITTGYYGGGTGLIVLTDRRLFFTKEGWIGSSSTDFPIEKVSSVEFKTGMLLGKITVFASGNKSEIENVNKADGRRIVDNMRARLSKAPGPVSEAPSSAAPETPLAQLEQLGRLRDAGVVTGEEFEAKKAELLKRL